MLIFEYLFATVFAISLASLLLLIKKQCRRQISLQRQKSGV